MLSKTLIFAFSILLLVSCDREASHSESQIFNCRITDWQVYGWLAEELDENEIPNIERELDEILFDAEHLTFSINTESGELTTGLEDVCCDRAVEMSVLASGTRGTDFWAVYETNHYGLVWTVSTETLVIQVEKNAPELPFVMSGSNVLRTGICVQD